MGYAFINFMKHTDVIEFYKSWMNKKWIHFSSRKRCDLAFGRIQGKRALEQHFSNSRTLLSAPLSCRPVVRADDDDDASDIGPPHHNTAQLSLNDLPPADSLPVHCARSARFPSHDGGGSSSFSQHTSFVSSAFYVSATNSNNKAPDFYGGF